MSAPASMSAPALRGRAQHALGAARPRRRPSGDRPAGRGSAGSPGAVAVRPCGQQLAQPVVAQPGGRRQQRGRAPAGRAGSARPTARACRGVRRASSAIRSAYRMPMPCHPYACAAACAAAPRAARAPASSATSSRIRRSAAVSGSSEYGKPAVSIPSTRRSVACLTPAGTRQQASSGTNSSVGPPAGDDRRQAAGHALQRRHAEPLAAVRQRGHVARPVERGDLVVAQVVLAGRRSAAARARSACALHLAAVGAGVDRAGAEVLDHQADVVAAGERLEVRARSAGRAPCARPCRRRTGSGSRRARPAPSAGRPA